MTVLDCECTNLGECQAIGGEQGESADHWELTRLRNLLRAAETAAAEAQRELETERWAHAQTRARANRAENLYDAACLELAKLHARGGR